MTEEDRLYTVPEVAKIFRLSGYTIREWLKDPEHPLKGVKMDNGQWRIKAADLQTVLDATFGE